jgi:hypothetical protein
MSVKVIEVRADSFFRLLLSLQLMADYFGVNNRVCGDKSRKQKGNGETEYTSQQTDGQTDEKLSSGLKTISNQTRNI